MNRRGTTSRLELARHPAVLVVPLVVAPFLLGLMPGGDGGTLRHVRAEQPLAFSHRHHLAYLTGGEHASEMVRMHLEALELDEEDAPPSMLACTMCHDAGANAQCSSCHDLLADRALVAREDVRACVTCHRGAWNSSAASIPSLTVCRSCHDAERAPDAEPDAQPDAEPRFRPDEEQRLREFLERGQDPPWVQLNTTPDDVFFSHAAHVRHAAMECAACHGEMELLEDPPTSVRVFTMDDCTRCHLAQGASTDCLTCHQ